jgi:hypothetical protein
VGAILSQKDGKFERVVAYANKSLTEAQRKFHPMEGECYALIWGVMHFRQYLHMKHFILHTDHKPLEWLATVSDAQAGRVDGLACSKTSVSKLCTDQDSNMLTWMH